MALSIYDVSNWETKTNYNKYDIYKYGNYYYYATQNHNSGLTFNSVFSNGTIVYNGLTYQYFFFTPSYNSKIEIKPSIKKVQFGDGYNSISNDGINNILLPFDLTFDRRSDAETRAILHFFNLHAGSARFIFTPPFPFNVNKIFVCSTWNHSITFMDNNNISARFEEMVI